MDLVWPVLIILAFLVGLVFFFRWLYSQPGYSGLKIGIVIFSLFTQTWWIVLLGAFLGKLKRSRDGGNVQ